MPAQVYYLPSFIYQAADGIRDYEVTGVQTCAVPISPDRRPRAAAARERRPPGPGGRRRPLGGRPDRRARQIGRASCRAGTYSAVGAGKRRQMNRMKASSEANIGLVSKICTVKSLADD